MIVFSVNSFVSSHVKLSDEKNSPDVQTFARTQGSNTFK